jgi:Bacterial antitoxin of type II TA system, VapB
MRTTVTIDDRLYTEAKVRAAAAGGSVGSVIEEALRAYLSRADQAAQAELEALPTVDTGGTRPGVNLDDMSSVFELLDEGRTLDDLR